MHRYALSLWVHNLHTMSGKSCARYAIGSAAPRQVLGRNIQLDRVQWRGCGSQMLQITDKERLLPVFMAGYWQGRRRLIIAFWLLPLFAAEALRRQCSQATISPPFIAHCHVSFVMACRKLEGVRWVPADDDRAQLLLRCIPHIPHV